MPYKEIGTPQAFVMGEEIAPSTYAVLGQLGIYGYQSMAGTTTVNLNMVDLNAVKAAYERSGNIVIKYMKLSWNQSGSTITDLVFGWVADLKHSTSVNDLWNYAPADLTKAVTDLQMVSQGDFKVYLLGATQANNTYTWTWESYSEEYQVVTGGAPTEATLRTSLEATGKIPEALNTLKSEASKGGVTITIRAYNITTLKAEYLRTEGGGYQGVPKDIYRTHLVLAVNFDTDKPIMGSPILPIIIVAIGFAVAVFIVGIGVAFYFYNMSSYKSTVEQRTVLTNNSDQTQTYKLPDGTTVTIPAHSSYEYSKSETVEGGGGSIIAQLPLIIGGTIVALAIIVLGSKYLGKKD